MGDGGWEVFVSTAPGLEGVTGGELRGLGFVDAVPESGGFTLRAGSDALWRLNLHLRTASRVLVRLAAFKAGSFGELERKARGVPWDRVLAGAPPEGSVSFDVTARKSRLYHTGAVEERLRRSLEEWSRGRSPARPPPAVPPLRIVARVLRDRLTLSADASGEHLHRRGYRQAVAKAPLRETLAAALLLASEWDRRTPLMDPFCGSGTLVIEGALWSRGVPPGVARRFTFEGWPSVDPAGRDRALRGDFEARGPAGPSITPPCVGSDRDAGAIEAAIANARRARVEGAVTLLRAPLTGAPFPELAPAGDADQGPQGLLVTNPPYGRRVGETGRLQNLYARLGALARERWSGGRLVLLSPDPALAGQLGLETRVLFRTRNGGLPVEALAADVP